MFIVVDLTVENLAEMGDLQVSQLFERVAIASQTGKHWIYVPYKVVESLMKTQILSVSALAPLTKIGEESFQYGDILADDTIPKLTIKYGPDEFKSGFGNQIIIGHRNVINGNYLSEPLLVVEDIGNDGDFYDFILNEEAKRINFSKPNFDFANLGGKAKLGKVMEKFSEQKRIVVFVIDQDSVVKISEVELEHRQTQLEKILNNGNCAGFVKFTPSHELENFLPISIVERVGKNVSSDQLANLKRLIQNQGRVKSGDCLWLYYDVKKGINGKKDKSGAIGIKNYENFTAEDKKWLCDKYNIVELETEIEKLQFPGFGEKVIPQFLKYQNYQESFVLYINSSFEGFNYWNHHFGDWLKTMLWYGCSDPVWAS